jgi:hypothetical protein
MITGLQGFFTIKIRQPCGTVRREYRFPNLILDAGLNGIGTNGASWATRIALGSSATPPDASQTGLISFGCESSSSNASTTGFVAGPPPYSWHRFSRRFAQGVATGTWSEVGIGRSGTALWSRSLILDGGGSPTTITVLAIEIVDIEYELRAYPSIVDVTGTRTISGIDYDYIMRPAALNAYSKFQTDLLIAGSWMNGGVYSSYQFRAYSGTAGAYTAEPSGTAAQGGGGSVSVAAYVNGSYTKTCTVTAGVDNANVSGGIKTALLMVGPGNAIWMYQCQFDPALPKDNTKTISLTYSCTWARRP